MRKLLIYVVIFLFAFFLLPIPKTFAQTCDPAACSNQPDDKKEGCLSDQINACTNLLQSAKNQEKTLNSQLNLIDGQMQVTNLKIEDTNLKIEKLKREIDDLAKRIDRIGATLDSLSEILLRRIVQTYKFSNSLSTLDLIFSSQNFADLIERLKYIQVAQSYDKKKLYELQATKLAYNDQKQDKQTRQAEAEKLNKDLAVYQKQLEDQKTQKQVLLTQTQGDESNYQSLLAKAEAQLSAFRGFVQSQGGLILIDADPNWPSGYYSQRDKRWGNIAIGNSDISVGESGCLLTSVAMVLTHRGNTVSPPSIASNASNFFDGDFIWSALTSLGFSTPRRTTDTSIVNSALASGNWVIVGLNYSKNTYGEPFHFVVITSKNGDDYNLFDPWKGPNTSFKSSYSGDYITEVITY